MSVAAARLTFRLARRSAVGWSLGFALVVIGSAAGYRTAYPHPADRAKLAAGLGASRGLMALFGVARHLETVEGFTAWRSLGVLGLMGAIWGLLTATRLLRGEEDRARWDQVLAGSTGRSMATASALVGLAAAWGLFVAIVIASALAAGAVAGGSRPLTSWLSLGVALGIPPLIFLGVGAVTSQVASTRKRAASLAGAVFGLSYAVRVVADGTPHRAELAWLSPLSWANLMHPLTGGDLRPLGLAVGVVAACAGGASVLAGRRDAGAGLWPQRERVAPHTMLLRGPTGLAVRLSTSALLTWVVAMAAVGALFGSLTKTMGVVTDSSGVQATLRRLGAGGAGGRAYLGLAFLTIAALACLAVAAQLGAAADEETSGRIDVIVSRRVRRGRWLLGRVGVAVAVAAIPPLGAGAAMALTAPQEGLGLARLLGAGANAAVPAVLVLGVGVLTLGWRPRAASATAYALVAWSFGLSMVGSLVSAPSWLLDLSLFRHMALAPAVEPQWATNAALVGLALVAMGAGGFGLARRDLSGP